MIPPQRNADFAAALERVRDIRRRPGDANFYVVCMDATARRLIGEARTPVPVAAPAGLPRLRVSARLQRVRGHRTGRRQAKASERGTRTDRACALRGIAAQYPGASRITLVMDNLNTHRGGAFFEAFERPGPGRSGPVSSSSMPPGTSIG